MSNPSSCNVATHLKTLAAAKPYRLAVVCPRGHDAGGRVQYTHLTFRQLDDDSDRVAHGLESVGIGRGTRTVLMVPPSLDFFALTFALFKVGAVPVLIDPGMGIRTLGRCLAEAQPEAFIGTLKAHVARRLLGWARKSLRVAVTTGRRFLLADHSVARLRRVGVRSGAHGIAPTLAAEMAAILFTSGSTGVAKGVVYTHGIFAAQVEILRKLYGIEAGEIDLATFPLFALFGPALGMTAIVPDMDPTRPGSVDPRKIIEAIEDWGVTNLFGSPALIDRMGRYGVEEGVHLPSLRRVISAGAPVSARVIERFASMLEPGVEIFTPYGATEALPVTSIGSSTILNETRHQTDRGTGVCVGATVRGIDVRIIPITDEPITEWDDGIVLPPGSIGEIVVRGPVVTQAYFNRPHTESLAKVHDSETGRFWHRMGDLGYLDDRERLWFCGRKSQRVVTAGGTLFTIPCEAVFNTHPDVARSALVGVRREEVTYPVVCVQLDPSRPRRPFAAIMAELAALAQEHPHTRSIRTFLRHSAFPVDIRHNAKIFREKLAVWATRQLTRRWRPGLVAETVELPPVASVPREAGAPA
jgi:olefin beta-lactone synthetase